MHASRAPPRAGGRDARAAPVGGRTWSWRPSYRRLAGEGQPPLRRQSKGRAGWSKGAVRQKRADSSGGGRLGHRPAPVAAPIHRPCHRQRCERRPEKRRVGQVGVNTCKSWWSPVTLKKKKTEKG